MGFEQFNAHNERKEDAGESIRQERADIFGGVFERMLNARREEAESFKKMGVLEK